MSKKSGMRLLSPRLLLPLALVATLVGVPVTRAGAECQDVATYSAAVTAPSEAAPGFPHRRVLTPEINSYLQTVAAESPRVVSGRYGTSVKGTPLTYALVSTPKNLMRIDQIVARQERLRDARVTTSEQAAAIAATSPAVVWYTANVHGNETSGADAALSLLYDLAARTDCAATEILDNLVVGIIPTQNPDGRDTFSRQNAYSFDMNRDWFARTQPETDAKLDLLSQYPPVLFIDAHEMGSSGYFFPPNADPIHHEISDESLGWINDLYGKALQEAFEERQSGEPTEWDYFNYNVYDLFYMGYGDTVPTTAFGAAGMTFEKGILDPDHQRWEEQHVAGWTSLRQAATHREKILTEHYQAHAAALADGRAGRLEPNLVVQPDNTVQFEVPDQRVRHYFIRADRASADAARLVTRLMQLGVEVHRLDSALHVEDLRRYGRAAKATTLPAGTYWIPMAQPQKRWIQAVLGEDPYTPFPYFYDVTSWSNPLLMNLDASISGAVLEGVPATPLSAVPAITVDGKSPEAAREQIVWFKGDTAQAVAAALDLDRNRYNVYRTQKSIPQGDGSTVPRGAFFVLSDPARDVAAVVERYPLALHTRDRMPDSFWSNAVRFRQPRVALFTPAAQLALGSEAYGQLRYLLERDWAMPYTPVTAAQVKAGALDDHDVFLVPGVGTNELTVASAEVKAWISAGGVYVGTTRGSSGGTPWAVANGLTTSQQQSLSGAQVGGTAFRVDVDRSTSPLTLGARDEAFWFNLGERVLTPTTTGATPVRYAGGEDFWFSGYGTGVEPLQGTAGLVEEQLGSGRVVLFSGEPNFRAYTEGVAFFLANAISYPRTKTVIPFEDVAAPSAATDVARARASAAAQTGTWRDISIEVPAAQAGKAHRVLATFSDEVRQERAGANVILRIPNPKGLDFEAHPFVWQLRPALEEAGVHLVSALF